jgi:hypothetical protein
LKQPVANLLLTRDNRSGGTTCSKSDEGNWLLQLVPTELSRIVFVKSAASLLYQTCAKPVHNKQFLSCHNKFQQACCWNKLFVGLHGDKTYDIFCLWNTNRKCE